MDPKKLTVPPQGTKFNLQNSHGINAEATYEQLVAMHTPPPEKGDTPFEANSMPKNFSVDTTRNEFAREVSRERFTKGRHE